MININSHFSDEQKQTLSDIGVVFDNAHDYSDDELMVVHDKITDYYQIHGFDVKGKPTNIASKCESLIDLFYDKFDI